MKLIFFSDWRLYMSRFVPVWLGNLLLNTNMTNNLAFLKTFYLKPNESLYFVMSRQI
jgi:hypothetical protein